MAFWRSLSGRLLLLTIVFVMLAEVLIFVPSVARFREQYIRERLEKAQIASLAVLASGNEAISEQLRSKLLQNAEVTSIAFKRDGARELMLMSPEQTMVDATYDLRDPSVFELIYDALICAINNDFRYVRIIGTPRFGDGEVVEIVIDDQKLKTAMLEYGIRILYLSLIISAITAGLVFLSVGYFLVRPTRRLIDGIVQFREDPEDADRIIQPTGATSEIGLAERELAEMQVEVRQALKQKSRLAGLGEAVAKINHDLRNILASAQLLADRLEASKDPIVGRVAPKLISSLDRAIRLCRHTLEYGRADEPPPERRVVELAPFIDEVGVALGVRVGDAEGRTGVGGVRFENAAQEGVTVDADADQLFRALLNLSRNAMQAIEASGESGLICIDARRAGDCVEIDVVDDGPGLPLKAREHLFRPFRGSVRKGGSGLGLAIAAELVRGHGGDLSLIESTTEGTRFRIVLPNERNAPRAENANGKRSARKVAIGEPG